jgi:rhamnosyltransferase
MKLLSLADSGDYWAFSDQDDVWNPNKISRAVDRLESMDDKAPNMYYHDYELTDENMNCTGRSAALKYDYSFQMAITECVHLGFATVMNRELRNLMLKGDDLNIISHDWWAEMVVMEFGNMYCDEFIGAKHRRLDKSVSSSNLKSRVEWFVKALKGNAEIQNLTFHFWNTFGAVMLEEDKRVLSWFVAQKYNFIKAIKKSFYFKRWRSNLLSEIVVRFLMLIGKI